MEATDARDALVDPSTTKPYREGAGVQLVLRMHHSGTGVWY